MNSTYRCMYYTVYHNYSLLPHVSMYWYVYVFLLLYACVFVPESVCLCVDAITCVCTLHLMTITHYFWNYVFTCLLLINRFKLNIKLNIAPQFNIFYAHNVTIPLKRGTDFELDCIFWSDVCSITNDQSKRGEHGLIIIHVLITKLLNKIESTFHSFPPYD